MQKTKIKTDIASILKVLETNVDFSPFPTFSNGEKWRSLNDGIYTKPSSDLIENAISAAEDAIPELNSKLFLTYQNTDERLPYETPQIRRRQMMGQIAMAIGLTSDRTALPQLEALIQATLNELTWAWPAHCPSGLPIPEEPTLDLSAAMTAFELAEISYLLGDLLSDEMHSEIYKQVSLRCIEPFLDKDHHWMANQQGHQVCNWAAVCICGVVGSAIYLEKNNQKLATIIIRCLDTLAAYIDTFDEDGGSTEGPAYWSYGFSYFVAIAHLLEEKTDGLINLFEFDKISKIATFPLRTQLSDNKFVNFSDSDEELTFIAGHIGFLSKKLDLQNLLSLSSETLPTDQHAMRITWMLRDLIWHPELKQKALTSNQHDWFENIQWMISRVNPENKSGFVVAAKGGSNHELHNQNDIGSFLLHWKNKSLINELGRGRYLKGYFGKERYSFLPTRSIGHSVPIINGFEQQTGQEFHSKLIKHSHSEKLDILHLNLTNAYPKETELSNFSRKFIVNHANKFGELTLIDSYEFTGEPKEFISNIITMTRPELNDGFVIITDNEASVEISYDPNWLAASVIIEKDVKFPKHSADVYRIQFSTHLPRKAGAINLKFRPI